MEENRRRAGSGNPWNRRLRPNTMVTGGIDMPEVGLTPL
jgi:hypothetical protein